MLHKKPRISSNVEDKKSEKPEEMSEDDKHLKEELNSLVERLTGPDEQHYMQTLENLRELIRNSTTSMTSVPRPLKYLKCHYKTLKDVYTKIKNNKTKMYCADVISVLAMAAHREKGDDERECLKYCLLGTKRDMGDWGHEYVRQLEGEIVAEWSLMSTETRKQLFPLVESIVNFDMHHNAEIQSCDLLMELDQLQLLKKHIDVSNYPRVCLYLVSCAAYVEDWERLNILEGVFDYYMKFEEYPRALYVGMLLNNHNMMEKVFRECKSLDMRKQLAYMIGMMQIPLQFIDQAEDSDDLKQIMSNSHISDHFLSLARELDIMEPKAPEDIYKTWLEGTLLRNTFNTSTPIDSAKHNLASSFVNAFVNAGFGRDKLVTGDDGKDWIYRNKDHGMMSATASLGLIHLWDVDGGLSPIDRYLYSNEDYIKSGSLLAIGIVNCGVKNECEPAKALLTDYILHNKNILRSGAILGLGLAYAGSYREDILNLLLPAMTDINSTPEVIALAAIACSLVAAGKCDYLVSNTIIQVLIDTRELNNTFFRFLPLALGICYLGKKDMIDVPTEALEVCLDPFKSMAQALLKICAYAGTGDVLVIQEILQICSEHFETEKKNEVQESTTSNGARADSGSADITSPATEVRENKSGVKELSTLQAVATLGVAIIAMGEEVGTEMSPRIYGQLARYGDPAVRKAMPLGIALCSMSNPQIPVIEILNKYSHDSDLEVALNAIFSMGLVGAGSNNARLAIMLRQLAQFHAKNPNNLFMVRLAQGLNHMGKGTMSLSPFHFDRQIINNVALAGLLITLFSFLDVKNTILEKSHYLLYTLAAAIHPRWLVTLDEDLEPLSVSVRIGQAIDIVGKAGTPKTIAGISTHNTPVLLAVGERAELATEEYIPLTPVMEGIVILRKKPQL